MSDDRQRDIDAEGQRAAIFHANKDKNEAPPARRGFDRLLGISPEGRLVDNVTEANRYAVNEKQPWIPVNLFSEDRSRLLEKVYMPNTRERPDVLVYGNHVYQVVTTMRSPAEYRRVMSLSAIKNPPTEEGTINVEPNP